MKSTASLKKISLDTLYGEIEIDASHDLVSLANRLIDDLEDFYNDGSFGYYDKTRDTLNKLMAFMVEI